MFKRCKQVLIEYFFTIAPIETLDVRILVGLALATPYSHLTHLAHIWATLQGLSQEFFPFPTALHSPSLPTQVFS